MKCTICGKINPNDARFCSDCAAPLNAGQDMEIERMENTDTHDEHRNQLSNQVWPQVQNPSTNAASAGTQISSGAYAGEENENTRYDQSSDMNSGMDSDYSNSSASATDPSYHPNQGYGAFIPEVRKRTIQEHVRNISVTLLVIATIIAVGFFGMQMFQSGGEQKLRDYLAAVNLRDVDRVMELSIPEDFYEFTEREFGAGKDDYRKILGVFFDESIAAGRINRLVKELPSPELLEKIRDYYETDWGVDRKDIEAAEVYELVFTRSEPGYEPTTETLIFPILKYRGKWYVYTWTFKEHTYVREEMRRMKERDSK